MPALPLACSVSTMRTKNVETGTWPALPPKEAQESLSTLVHILKEEGCSVMALEMMEDLEVAPMATGIAVASGLPTWLGISCRRAADGTTLNPSTFPASPSTSSMPPCCRWVLTCSTSCTARSR